MTCRQPEKIWAVVRVGDVVLAVVETNHGDGRRYYVGKLVDGHVPDHAPEDAFFANRVNAECDLARLERFMRS